ncbi:MAG: hypothetical protein FWG24_06565 [Eggerthellaceae bacterium]|nr:hypothetical protein [Eggerthellaceae bacterium]
METPEHPARAFFVSRNGARACKGLAQGFGARAWRNDAGGFLFVRER